jgi:EAL domain-containing protein (putative c-di-GMP-specific phosphodiesterase class I)
VQELEFILFYQPKVNMRTGEIVGAELLIRWQHPQKGLLPPVLFLPVIENHQIAVEIGELVIETALINKEKRQAVRLDIPVIVFNIVIW